MGATTSDGVTVEVHDLGGSGPPLVLSHATGFHGRVWEPLAAHLRTSFHCLSFDARGHGGTPVPPQCDFDWHGFGLDVLAVVDELGLSHPFAFGHSSGATALLLAEQARPGTFMALCCYEPVVVPADPPLGPDPDNWMGVAARRRRAVFASRDDAFQAYSAKPPLSDLEPAALRAYVDHAFEDRADGTVALRCLPEHEARIYEMASAHDCFGRLTEIDCPVTVITGAESSAAHPAMSTLVVGALRHGRAENLPALGHFGPLQDAATTASAVRRALLGDVVEGRPSSPTR